MTKAEREAKLKLRFEELNVYERKFRSEGFSYIAGVDEVGRGPLAGSVVAAAVILPQDFYCLGIDDSKKLSEKKRELLFDEIRHGAIAYGIGCVDNEEIDRINILEATKKAMKNAIEEAEKRLRDAIGSGIDMIIFDAVKIEAIKTPQISLIKGDSKSISVAAASIIAKVTRDRMMEEYDAVYPGYGFSSNKGYGTALHYEGIKKQGMTPIHRRSFLKKLL